MWIAIVYTACLASNNSRSSPTIGDEDQNKRVFDKSDFDKFLSISNCILWRRRNKNPRPMSKWSRLDSNICGFRTCYVTEKRQWYVFFFDQQRDLLDTLISCICWSKVTHVEIREPNLYTIYSTKPEIAFEVSMLNVQLILSMQISPLRLYCSTVRYRSQRYKVIRAWRCLWPWVTSKSILIIFLFFKIIDLPQL